MAPSDDRQRATRRLLLSRMRLLTSQGFFGTLLMHMKLNLTDAYPCAAFDEERLYLNPAFLDAVSDEELDYVLSHLIMHVALRHRSRGEGHDRQFFDDACDIVVNSMILESHAGDGTSITLRGFGGVQPHLAPDGTEGASHSVEEVYEMLRAYPHPPGNLGGLSTPPGNRPSKGGMGNPSGPDSGNAPGKAGGSKGKASDRGKGGGVGSNWASPGSGRGTLGSHGRWDTHPTSGGAGAGGPGNGDGSEQAGPAAFAGSGNGSGMAADVADGIWNARLATAVEIMLIRDPSNSRGLVPGLAMRRFEDIKNPKVDWRTVLADFVDEEVVDWSFSPPDRRFPDSPFFLPDFNDTDVAAKDILFMIDTSGSMSDALITQCYSEVKGAIDQFDGRLTGLLGFFDAKVVPPIPFVDEHELLRIKPKGGGGTSFKAVFAYVKDHMFDNLPKSIIILTDGYCPTPPESMALGIPVLWAIAGDGPDPYWGRIVRIPSK